ncbi:hypothetical protein ACHAW6_006682 [Cyclotella cf. meneghiniana]
MIKSELDHIAELGVLAPMTESEWTLPSFIIPKQNGQLHWLSILCQLNKVIRHKQYPLPIITDILHKLSVYNFFTKLDINMHYYTFKLDKHSQGLYASSLHMGNIKIRGSQWDQNDLQILLSQCVLTSINDADVYIYYIGAFSPYWDLHVKMFANIMSSTRKLFHYLPKCEWSTKETYWMGYWLTPQGLKPLKKKMPSYIWISPRMPLSCECSLAELILTGICGQVVPTYSKS